jgi:hypothetical protein
VPNKKTSCERVNRAIAGPGPDQILDAIKSEYWLPQAEAPKTNKDAAPTDPKTKVTP